MSTFANVTATFSETMDSATITALSFRLREVGETTDILAVVSYSGLTATLDPVGALSFGKSYEATISGSVTDVAGNPMVTDYSWTLTTASLPECPCTIWPGTTVPGTPWNPDPNGIGVGVKFRSSLNGYITALRFYKGSSNTGVHVGHIWEWPGTCSGKPRSPARPPRDGRRWR